jgi:hypothetical protein
LAQGTVVETAKPARRSDIVVGSRVLVVFKAEDAVSDILIVTRTAKGLGSAVSAVTPTSMTFKLGKISVKVSTVGAKIEKTVRGRTADIVKGGRVIVRGVRPPPIRKGKRLITQMLIAFEVVVLSPRSAFR